MSVKTEIERITANIAGAYAACGEKGADMPEVRDSASLAGAIRTIKTGGSFAVPLVVTVDPGAAVTASQGGDLLSAAAGEDGTATLILPAPGIWEVRASLNGKEMSAEVEVINGYTQKFTLASKPPRLPEGYIEVEYIESSGTQYIDTQVMPYNIKTVMDVQPLAGGEARQSYFGEAGGYTSSNKKYYNFYIMWHDSTNNNVSINYSQQASKPSSYRTIMNAYEDGKRIIVTLDAINKVAAIDNDSKAVSYNRGSTGKLYLLANYISSYYTETERWPITARLFSCRISNSSTTLRDYVPCINPDGAVGLYDLIQNKFYANAGTGEFIAGPAV